MYRLWKDLAAVRLQGHAIYKCSNIRWLLVGE